MKHALIVLSILLVNSWGSTAAAEPLRFTAFQVDVTPPLGSPLCNGNVKPAAEIVSPLTARGIVLLGAGDPIVLCAFDWVGIGNESYDAFRAALAQAVATTADRVALHTLHQHDTPGSDFATERLLAQNGLGGKYSNPDLDRKVMQRLAAAAKESLSETQPITHVGLGSGKVERVASNRRILGPDGRVALQRQSSGGRNPAARAAPEGTIDPLVRLVAFWNEGKPLGVMTYYATHPQSYYGRGGVNWDFVGMARAIREKALPGAVHIHFDGAGGNVAAGKYNDGAPANRPALAQRLADGMKQAWESQRKIPLAGNDVGWKVNAVSLPVRESPSEEELLADLVDESQPTKDRLRAARDLTFMRRMKNGHRVPLSCLKLGSARILHMPGELFVEYQLAAQQMRPDDFVAMAAYGDYGPGYIGTKIAYGQGGYETGIVSRVAPEVEQVLVDAMKQLLEPIRSVEQVTGATLGRAIALADSGKNMIHILDADGHVVWQYPAVKPRDVWVLPNGNVLFTHATGVKEITRDKKIVWQYSFPETSEIHACQPLANGVVMIAESGPMRVVEIDRHGKILKKVRLQSAETHKHRQMRCCRKLSNGHYLVGQYFDGVIREYDETGAIISDIKHSDAHAGLRLPNGHTLCSFGDAHRLVDYDPLGKPVWSVEENDLPGCPLRFVGPAWRLPNGNTIICNWAGHGYVGKQPQLVEITAEKKVVAELFDYTRFGTISGFFVLEENSK